MAGRGGARKLPLLGTGVQASVPGAREEPGFQEAGALTVTSQVKGGQEGEPDDGPQLTPSTWASDFTNFLKPWQDVSLAAGEKRSSNLQSEEWKLPTMCHCLGRWDLGTAGAREKWGFGVGTVLTSVPDLGLPHTGQHTFTPLFLSPSKQETASFQPVPS